MLVFHHTYFDLLNLITRILVIKFIESIKVGIYLHKNDVIISFSNKRIR